MKIKPTLLAVGIALSFLTAFGEEKVDPLKAPTDVAAAPADAKATASGLKSKVIKKGTGKKNPAATDTVTVHYSGWTTDGKLFDSSHKRNKKASFPLNRVIPCWTEGVAMIKVGGKAKLVCPSEIAYGDAGRPPSIPGGAALVFDVELLEIVAAE